MSEIADLYVKLSAHTAGFLHGIRSAETATLGFEGRLGSAVQSMAKLGAVAAIAGLGMAAWAVTGAADLQAQLVLIHTQAGQTGEDLDAIKESLYKMAPAVGAGPAELAKALYHVESVGYTGAAALDIVRVAAEGAAVGHADLEKTASSLVATVRSGIPGVRDAADAMAQLNAIVGAGNMRMEDLNGAWSSGLPVAAATFGVSLQSVGAALAYLTDRGMPAVEAGTRLRMSLSLMAAPTAHAAKLLMDAGLSATEAKDRTNAMSLAFKDSGVTTTQLADDLRKPNGISVALRDLKTHMVNAGVSSQEQSAVISRAFGGGRSGAAIMAMWNDLDSLDGKFKQIGGASGNFGKAWTETQKTAKFQWDQLNAQVQVLRDRLGDWLLPKVQAVAKALQDFGNWLGQNKGAAQALGIVVGGVLVVAMYAAAAAAVTWAAGMIAATWPVLAVIAAVAAVVVVGKLLIDHWGDIVDIAKKVGGAIHDFVVGGFNKVKDAIGGAAKWVATKAVEIKDAIVGGIVGAFDKVKDAVVGAASWVGTKFGEIKDDIVKAVTGAVSWVTQEIPKIPFQFGYAIGWVLGTVIKFAIDLPGHIKDGLVAVIKAVAKWAIDFAKSGADATIGFIGSVGDWFVKLPGRVKDWLVDVIKAVAEWAINFAKSGASAAGGFVGGIGDWFVKLPGRVKDWLVGVITTVANWAIDLVKGGAKATGDFVGGIVKGITELPGKFWNAAVDMLQGFINGIVAGAKAVWDTIKGWGEGIVKGFKDALGIGSPSWMFHNFATDMLQGFINGIANGAKAVFDTVKNFAGDVANNTKHFFGIHSPSTMFHGFGLNLMQGLALGIQNGAKLPQDALGKVSLTVPPLSGSVPALVGANGPTLSASSDGGGKGATLVINVNRVDVHGVQDVHQLWDQLRSVALDKGRGTGVGSQFGRFA